MKWRTAQGEAITLGKMKTSHLFNCLKMFYNHLAEVYRMPIYYFTRKYAEYHYLAINDPFRLIDMSKIFIKEIDKRKDMSDKSMSIIREMYPHIKDGIMNMKIAIIARDVESGWKGKGYCRMRSINKENDWCNEKSIKDGLFCKEHTCVIRGCKEQMSAEYPLLPGSPRFCSEHHNPEFAGKFGCDFTGPDDFDIPEPWGD
jgi:hypothetical protein